MARDPPLQKTRRRMTLKFWGRIGVEKIRTDALYVAFKIPPDVLVCPSEAHTKRKRKDGFVLHHVFFFFYWL